MRNSPGSESKRRGLLAGGNFIIDHVKMIDYYPEEENLSTILAESSSGGGGPYNVLKDLAKMGAPFPLAAAGLIGTDAGGDWIMEDCAQTGINTTKLTRTAEAPTSYTDAFTVKASGRRTFFHQPGTNALLAPGHIDFTGDNSRIFYLGYLLLLDTLDALAADGRTGASLILEAARAAGCLTMADVVSKHHPQFAEIVRASLPCLDVLVLNELEAGRVTSRDLRPGGKFDVMEAGRAAGELLGMGVRSWVVVHCVEGCVASSKAGMTLRQPSVKIPERHNKGATGAGDAFAAGLIWGLHEDMPMEETLNLAVCAAAMCLTDPTTSNGMKSAAECLALGAQFGYRSDINQH